MRKRIVIILTAAICLLGASMFALSPFALSMGTYIAADIPVILLDKGSGEPIVMQGASKAYQTGDRVLIVHNGTMMLSYPAQMNVYFCIRLKKGDASEVPEEALKTLEEMGWLEEKTFGQTQ